MEIKKPKKPKPKKPKPRKHEENQENPKTIPGILVNSFSGKKFSEFLKMDKNKCPKTNAWKKVFPDFL